MPPPEKPSRLFEKRSLNQPGADFCWGKFACWLVLPVKKKVKKKLTAEKGKQRLDPNRGFLSADLERREGSRRVGHVGESREKQEEAFGKV